MCLCFSHSVLNIYGFCWLKFYSQFNTVNVMFNNRTILNKTVTGHLQIFAIWCNAILGNGFFASLNCLLHWNSKLTLHHINKYLKSGGKKFWKVFFYHWESIGLNSAFREITATWSADVFEMTCRTFRSTSHWVFIVILKQTNLVRAIWTHNVLHVYQCRIVIRSYIQWLLITPHILINVSLSLVYPSENVKNYFSVT